MVASSALIVVLLFVVPAILFYSFSKTKSPFKLGILFGLIHLCLVALLSILIYVNIKSDAESVMGFLIAYGLDIPVSLLTVPITAIGEMIVGKSFMLANFWVPSIVFVIFGSFQYFLIGLGLGYLFKRLFKNKEAA